MTAIEQAGIEVFFELLDLEGNGRLRHEENFCSLGKRQLSGDCVENLQPTIRHGALLPCGSIQEVRIKSQFTDIR
jgi:hypothetical protein